MYLEYYVNASLLHCVFCNVDIITNGPKQLSIVYRHRGPEDWWSMNATVEDWFDEMVGQANVINRFGRVRMEDFRSHNISFKLAEESPRPRSPLSETTRGHLKRTSASETRAVGGRRVPNE